MVIRDLCRLFAKSVTGVLMTLICLSNWVKIERLYSYMSLLSTTYQIYIMLSCETNTITIPKVQQKLGSVIPPVYV